ncbi:hypothetical protein B0T26DRAFT_137794 [Lasiosphaeria miniovina]|uniref:Uncharacterized protein n=1 Tax=Lasiosphaeria miniovina TaxID=1954250 RepID=A0AA40E9M4_9PEZI|nr:uncharacterized protein B0T26DRAFT_137794 [Lasiosphaeria miniovina]KAK0727473.1 hypothetical protein B0T26DRAFT_137794 [Lasiosphaeria miniovina]
MPSDISPYPVAIFRRMTRSWHHTHLSTLFLASVGMCLSKPVTQSCLTQPIQCLKPRSHRHLRRGFLRDRVYNQYCTENYSSVPITVFFFFLRPAEPCCDPDSSRSQIIDTRVVATSRWIEWHSLAGFISGC